MLQMNHCYLRNLNLSLWRVTLYQLKYRPNEAKFIRWIHGRCLIVQLQLSRKQMISKVKYHDIFTLTTLEAWMHFQAKLNSNGLQLSQPHSKNYPQEDLRDCQCLEADSITARPLQYQYIIKKDFKLPQKSFFMPSNPKSLVTRVSRNPLLKTSCSHNGLAPAGRLTYVDSLLFLQRVYWKFTPGG